MIIADNVPSRFEELHARAVPMADEQPTRMHAEAMGFPQLWLHTDGRALYVTRCHCYAPTPDVLAAISHEFENVPRVDGEVSVFCICPTRRRPT